MNVPKDTAPKEPISTPSAQSWPDLHRQHKKLSKDTFARLTKQPKKMTRKPPASWQKSYSSINVREGSADVCFGSKLSHTFTPNADWRIKMMQRERSGSPAAKLARAHSARRNRVQQSKLISSPLTASLSSKQTGSCTTCSCEVCNGMGFPDCYTTLHNCIVLCPACHFQGQHV